MSVQTTSTTWRDLQQVRATDTALLDQLLSGRHPAGGTLLALYGEDPNFYAQLTQHLSDHEVPFTRVLFEHEGEQLVLVLAVFQNEQHAVTSRVRNIAVNLRELYPQTRVAVLRGNFTQPYWQLSDDVTVRPQADLRELLRCLSGYQAVQLGVEQPDNNLAALAFERTGQLWR